MNFVGDGALDVPKCGDVYSSETGRRGRRPLQFVFAERMFAYVFFTHTNQKIHLTRYAKSDII